MPTEIFIIIISALIGLFTGLAIGKMREKPMKVLLIELSRTNKMLKAAIKVNHSLTDLLFLETGKQVEKLSIPENTFISFIEELAKMQDMRVKESKSEDKEE